MGGSGGGIWPGIGGLAVTVAADDGGRTWTGRYVQGGREGLCQAVGEFGGERRGFGRVVGF